MLICPPQIQEHVDELLRAATPPILTVEQPGDQGAGVTGIQGMGVRTPNADAVAAATIGFSIEVQVPNGIIFTNAALSVIFAHGVIDMTLLTGSTVKEDGALPKEHWVTAPLTTCCDMSSSRIPARTGSKSGSSNLDYATFVINSNLLPVTVSIIQDALSIL
jgi:hypothetical protein